MDTLMILSIAILCIIVVLVIMIHMLMKVGGQIRQLKLDLELDRANHQYWVDEFLLLSSRLRTLGEESADWARLVENHFHQIDETEKRRRIKARLPELKSFSLRKQEAKQQEGESSGGEG